MFRISISVFLTVQFCVELMFVCLFVCLFVWRKGHTVAIHWKDPSEYDLENESQVEEVS